MPAFTLGRLAKLYGFHRSSVYEAVDKGRVSAGRDLNGQRVIDLSEAIRVWGEPPTNPTPQPDTPAGPDTRHPTPQPGIMSELLEEVRRLREGQEADREENRRLHEAVAVLREALAGLRVALLEHKPAGIEEGERRAAEVPAEGRAGRTRKAAKGQAPEKEAAHSSDTGQPEKGKAKSFADLLEML